MNMHDCITTTYGPGGRRHSDKELRVIKAYRAGAGIEWLARAYALPIGVLADILDLDDAAVAKAEAIIRASQDITSNAFQSGRRSREREDDMLSNPLAARRRP